MISSALGFAYFSHDLRLENFFPPFFSTLELESLDVSLFHRLYPSQKISCSSDLHFPHPLHIFHKIKQYSYRLWHSCEGVYHRGWYYNDKSQLLSQLMEGALDAGYTTLSKSFQIIQAFPVSLTSPLPAPSHGFLREQHVAAAEQKFEQHCRLRTFVNCNEKKLLAFLASPRAKRRRYPYLPFLFTSLQTNLSSYLATCHFQSYCVASSHACVASIRSISKSEIDKSLIIRFAPSDPDVPCQWLLSSPVEIYLDVSSTFRDQGQLHFMSSLIVSVQIARKSSSVFVRGFALRPSLIST